MTLIDDLLLLLAAHPNGIDRKAARATLGWGRNRFNNLVASLDKQGAIKLWRDPETWNTGTSYIALNLGIRPLPDIAPELRPPLPPVSSRAQEAYKVVRQLQHRDARHLAHAAGYSYGYAAEMMAELTKAGAL